MSEPSSFRVRQEELIRRDVRAYLELHERKDRLRFLTAGSVDDGKSTLIGRLLYDAKMIYEDQLAGVLRDSKVHGTTGDGSFDPALLTDGLKAEREQGITIDVAYRYFSTEKRNFIICDAPGHEQYTRNMATGASRCDLAVILIDARHGVLPQTKRHSFICSLLGIRHFVIAVNKMDLVGYREEVFRQIRADYEGFAARLEVGDLHFLPMAALKGENVVDRSPRLPWYQGAPLLAYLENVEIVSDRNLIDFRFPVQYVLRPDGDFRGFAGTLASGVVRRGDEVLVLPAGRRTRVRTIVTADGELEEAFAPMAVVLTTTEEVDISRGCMLTHPHNVPRLEREFEAMLVWLDERRLAPGQSYLLKCGTSTVPATVTALRYAYDINTLKRHDAPGLELNQIGRAVLVVQRPLCFDSYARNRQTGAFVLIDRLTNYTAAAGLVLEQRPAPALPRPGPGRAPETAGLEATRSRVPAAARAQRLGQEPFTVWLTGLPGSGKSSLAYALEARLFELGYVGLVLDGQNLRLDLSRDLGFSEAERAENVRRAAAVARLGNAAGLIVIAALVSPIAADRRLARAAIGPERFLEVFVDAPLEICATRGNQELFARARRGEVADFAGITGPYEPPTAPDLRFASDRLTVADGVAGILTLLRARGWVRPAGSAAGPG